MKDEKRRGAEGGDAVAPFNQIGQTRVVTIAGAFRLGIGSRCQIGTVPWPADSVHFC